MSARLIRTYCALLWLGLARVSGWAAEPVFEHFTVDDNIAIGYGVALADVDGDRRIDIVLADKEEIVWYRNQHPAWDRHVIARNLTEQDNVCVAAADIDGDGKAEIAAGAGWNPGDTINSGALFYFLPGEDRTQPWEPIQLAHEPTIHRIRWARNDRGTFDLLALPLHGRGNKNGAGDGVRFLAYHPPPDPKAAWTTTAINRDWHAAHNLDVFRFGRGTADELLVASREGVFNLNPISGSYRISPIATNGPGMPDFVGAGEVRAGRVSGRFAFVTTIEPMHGNQLVVYTAPHVNAASPLWNRNVIDGTLVDGHALACGDLLGQGRDQIVAGWRAMNRPGSRVGIRLYVAANENGDRWNAHVIDDNEMACEDLQLADIDGDGSLDIVAAGRGTKNLKIYFNRNPIPAPAAASGNGNGAGAATARAQ